MYGAVSVCTRYGYGFGGFGYGVAIADPRYTHDKAYLLSTLTHPQSSFLPLFDLVLACVSVFYSVVSIFFKVCTHLLFVHSHTTSFNKYIYRKYH